MHAKLALTPDRLSGTFTIRKQTEAKVIFDQSTFMRETLRSPEAVTGLLTAYRFRAPPIATVQKWFQRGRVPTEWIAIILALLEIDNGQAVSLVKFMR